MSCGPGDVIRIFDVLTKPQKPKLHVCVCADDQMFLRINSEDLWGVAYLATKKMWPFLHHDSYVELNSLVRNSSEYIQGATLEGALNKAARLELVAACKASKVLPERHKLIVTDRLSF